MSLKMIEYEPFVYLHPKLKSSLYHELEVQEIFWTDKDCINETSYDSIRTVRRKRKVNKVSRRQKNSFMLEHHSYAEDRINCLSDEILLKVFSFLDQYSVVKCSQVCHRWMKIGHDVSLWKKVHICNKTLQGDIDLGSILKRKVSVLKMTHCQILRPIQMASEGCQKRQQLIKKSKKSSCPQENRVKSFQLQYFDASVCMFGDDVLLSILKRCKSLKFLSLEGTTLCDDLMSAVGQNSNLREINLAQCRCMASYGLSKLTNGCKKLVSINLSWMNLSKEALLKVACSFPHLEEINLSGHKTGMDDEIVQVLNVNCPKLKVLDLSDCPLIGNDSIDSLIKNTQLTKISLSRCHRITASKICDIASMKSLAHLELFGFTNQVVLKQIKIVNPSLTINLNILSPIAKMS